MNTAPKETVQGVTTDQLKAMGVLVNQLGWKRPEALALTVKLFGKPREPESLTRVEGEVLMGAMRAAIADMSKETK